MAKKKQRKRVRKNEWVMIDGPAAVKASRRVLLTVKHQPAVDIPRATR